MALKFMLPETSTSIRFNSVDEDGMADFARRLAPLLDDVLLLTLEGGLGAGKTTLVRALLAALGYEGKVKSPTYALVEPYLISGRDVFHFDLYRLSDPEELDFLGLDDYFTGSSLCLVEWADKGAGMLPEADLNLMIEFADERRHLILTGLSAVGLSAVRELNTLI